MPGRTPVPKKDLFGFIADKQFTIPNHVFTSVKYDNKRYCYIEFITDNKWSNTPFRDFCELSQLHTGKHLPFPTLTFEHEGGTNLDERRRFVGLV